jgi:antitoxin HicB
LKKLTNWLLKKIIAVQLKQEMNNQHFTKTGIVKKMNTTRSAVDNALDSEFNTSIETLDRFACALGKQLSLTLR